MSGDEVKSAARAVEILEHFRIARAPLSMTELADGLGYPVSSESPTRDGAVQTFQGGTIAWVAGRAKVTYR